MLTKRKILLSCAVMVMISMTAQDNFSKSFADFKKGLFDNYNGFRSQVLENYDGFLEGVWVEYQGMQPEKSSSKPKPRRVPVSPDGNATEVIQDSVQKARDFIAENSSMVPLQDFQEADSTVIIDFFGIPLEIERPGVAIARKLSGTTDYALQWRELEKTDADKAINDRLRSKADEMGLNDYLCFQLVKKYVDQSFKDIDITSRISMTHYLLANMGFDVRIGLSARNNPVLLVPFKQTVYGRPFMMIDNYRYYIFADNEVDLTNPDNLRISTCQLPRTQSMDNFLELKLDGLNLAYKPYKFDINHGNLSIHGEINGNIFPILYNYPQMPTADYALSVVSQETRDSVVSQFKNQLLNIDGIEAINSLLYFTQQFDYAIDEDYHGFEKPYFFEEMLYYPKNDCEDRAIFYSYLLWNVLGIENQLLYYPGHESVGVKLKDQMKGDSYFSGGKRFFISDPTYIGAPTGEGIPEYLHETPKVDFHYK